jgi:hypothetical protein
MCIPAIPVDGPLAGLKCWEDAVDALVQHGWAPDISRGWSIPTATRPQRSGFLAGCPTTEPAPGMERNWHREASHSSSQRCPKIPLRGFGHSYLPCRYHFGRRGQGRASASPTWRIGETKVQPPKRCRSLRRNAAHHPAGIESVFILIHISNTMRAPQRATLALFVTAGFTHIPFIHDARLVFLTFFPLSLNEGFASFFGRPFPGGLLSRSSRRLRASASDCVETLFDLSI